MAYVLGYFFADGSLRMGRCHQLSFHCVQSDGYLLERIKSLLDSHHTIGHRPERINKTNGSKSKAATTLAVISRFMVRDLNSLFSLQPSKSTKDLPLPFIPDQFLVSFVLGYMDGDGCVSENWREVTTISFHGSSQFILQLQLRIVELLDLPQLKISIDKTGLHSFQWSSKSDVNKLANWLYTGETSLYLFRKKTRLDSFLSRRSPGNVSLSKDSTTGFLGVSQNRRTTRWVVEICSSRRRWRLNSYSSKFEAAYVYNCAARLVHGPRARLNTLPSDLISGLDDRRRGELESFVLLRYARFSGDQSSSEYTKESETTSHSDTAQGG
jgi:hypothetical protein